MLHFQLLKFTFNSGCSSVAQSIFLPLLFGPQSASVSMPPTPQINYRHVGKITVTHWSVTSQTFADHTVDSVGFYTLRSLFLNLSAQAWILFSYTHQRFYLHIYYQLHCVFTELYRIPYLDKKYPVQSRLGYGLNSEWIVILNCNTDIL